MPVIGMNRQRDFTYDLNSLFDQVYSLLAQFCLMTSRPSPRLLRHPAHIQHSLLVRDSLDAEHFHVIHAIFFLNLSIIRWKRLHASWK